jgi:glycosyltransferase involved in cell wall biosynthesis
MRENPPLKVALDATPLTLSSGGLRRYAEELSVALAETFPEDEFWLLSDQAFSMPAPRLPNLRRGRAPGNFLERRWWICGVQREMARTGAAVFHGVNFDVPYAPLRPSVLSLHDLSPWMDASWQPAAARVRQRTPFLIGLGMATMVLTQTEAIRREAIEHFGIHPGRIAAVPLAASAHFRPVPAPPEVRPEPPFFLYVGTLEPRKNLPFLLQAWREVRKKHNVGLALAGRRRPDFPPLAPEPGLRVLGEVAEDLLPALYSTALACVYPSLYEGFGLPVLEAMQCGAAVITSRAAAIAEVAGDAALQLDAGDAQAWVEALAAAAEQPEAVAGWRARALKRACQFSWQRTAQLTREVYVEAQRQFTK